MLDVSGYKVISLGRLGAFQKNVIIRIGAASYRLSWPDPQAFLSNGIECGRYNVATEFEMRAANHLFVFCIDAAAHTQ